MTQITLNQDQVRAVQEATGIVEVRDERGNLLGYMSRRPEDPRIADAKGRLESKGPWHTTQEVLNHLNSLEQG